MATAAVTGPIPLTPRTHKPSFHLPPQRPATPNTYFKSPFNPTKHLTYNGPPKRHTMAKLSLPDVGISPIGVSEPFELFSKEAVKYMRDEVLSDEVWENCRFASSLAACQLRGMSPKYAKFVYDAWTNPQTLAIISEIAGIELVPNMDYEIGHINISVQHQQSSAKDNDTQDLPAAPVVNWHKDSYPFVCVLMLSDASEMKGGETALQTGTGEIMKVRGPQMGSAVVLQGRYITHIALPSTNFRERITMVTSFRPKDPSVPEDSVLTTIRPVSDLRELYNQWTEYRIEIVEERCRRLVKKVRGRKRVGRDFDVEGVKAEIEELKNFLERTSDQLVAKEEDPVSDEKAEEKEQVGKADEEFSRNRKRARLN